MTPRELLASLALADRRQRQERAAMLMVSAAAAGAPWAKDKDAIKKLYKEIMGDD